ncbi:WD40 repeat domain-containing protein [Paractinoplanes lichenicola]|uniref:WD40 repeat domain-containing protein n=1 Tax=Paractinoplanes lichenicola TaxID=2802976 RepID=A0ABS1VM04_9ACTN|nr:WD40 repeat domain-containing protein [Actinoplanes lichenicola]MBL7255680.1 WD40 repeat domain-containing protein [Actinoplanes lichenicola]
MPLIPIGAKVESWAVALHATADDEVPLGAGFVVDQTLILTSTPVAFADGELRDLWVAFPQAQHTERRKVRACRLNGRAEQRIDIALLELEQPVPVSVTPARLRLAATPGLVGRQWRACGAGGLRVEGTIGDGGREGLVRLTTTAGDAGVTRGFTGAALWSPNYRAVVGLVVDAEAGQALVLAHADEQLPGLKLSALGDWRLEDADEPSLAAWGWALTTDDEAGRHWLPRARGVASGAEKGSRFRGRSAALRELRSFLDRPEAAGRPLVVTGSPGVGKSAVLGRIVTTADPGVVAALPPDDIAERATTGSVACAVHAKGKTALEIAEEIARSAAARLPQALVDLVPALRSRLGSRPARFNLVVDALDEVVTPGDARALVEEVLVPLARSCAELGAQVVVGTRRSDDAGDLLGGFGADAHVIDLDAPAFFSAEDLAAYAQATLQHAGGGAYADPVVAEPVARRIAELADRNFLIAGLVARTRALRDVEPVDPARVSFTATVGDALNEYVHDLPPAGGASAGMALTALAYAETPGLPMELWRLAVRALGAEVAAGQLRDFARSSAANFLVESGDPEQPTYRLFHQALNDALLSSREEAGRRRDDERRLVGAWLGLGRADGWDEAPEYLLRSLPAHAARADLIDELLADDGYLLHARLERLLPHADTARTEAGRARKLLLQRTPVAVTAEPEERAAQFSVVDRLDALGAKVSTSGARYRARWAHTPPRLERTVLEGHSLAVHDVCAIVVDGRSLLASGGEDGTVRLWDPITNQTVRSFACHDDCIRSLSAVTAGGVTLLATASHDGTIGLWDPRSGTHRSTFVGHDDWIRNLCSLPMPAGDLLVSAGDDRTVRIWDVASGMPARTLRGHTGWVTAVTHVPVPQSYGILASAGFDSCVLLWDPLSGRCLRELHGHDGWVTTLYPVVTDKWTLLASGGYDGTVRLWDPIGGREVATLTPGSGPITDICTIRSEQGCILAVTGEDGTVRLWDVETGVERRGLRGHASWIRAVCELPVSGRNLLATAGDDGTVRVWDPRGDLPRAVRESELPGLVADVSAVRRGDETLVATAGGDGAIRLWELATGAARGELGSHFGPVNALCATESGLASAGEDGHVLQWDVDGHEPPEPFQAHEEPVKAVCVVDRHGEPIMASAGDDMTVRLWEPRTARPVDGLIGHRNWVTSLTTVVRDGRQVLASADKNGVVRLWDGAGGRLWEQNHHNDGVNALCALQLPDRQVVVSAGIDCTIRLWDLVDGRPIRVLTGHTAEVTGVTPAVLDGRTVLVSCGLDRTVRVWDPRLGKSLLVIPVHHRALAVRQIDDHLIVGLDRGLLALTLGRL